MARFNSHFRISSTKNSNVKKNVPLALQSIIKINRNITTFEIIGVNLLFHAGNLFSIAVKLSILVRNDHLIRAPLVTLTLVWNIMTVDKERQELTLVGLTTILTLIQLTTILTFVGIP